MSSKKGNDNNNNSNNNNNPYFVKDYQALQKITGKKRKIQQTNILQNQLHQLQQELKTENNTVSSSELEDILNRHSRRSLWQQLLSSLLFDNNSLDNDQLQIIRNELEEQKHRASTRREVNQRNEDVNDLEYNAILNPEYWNYVLQNNKNASGSGISKRKAKKSKPKSRKR